MRDLLANKRVLLTGVNGQVGSALVKQLGARCQLVTVARADADYQLDLTQFDNIESLINDVKPDIVINPAAYTQVDRAEEEPDLARRINAEAPGVLARACKNIDALLIHYSTDYVFAGDGNTPYKEDDAVSPVNVYGQTKLDGERAIQASGCRHLILRTCWVYDAHGGNFLNAILNRARSMAELKVVSDQIGTPTWAGFIAQVTREILEQSIAGRHLHAAGDRVFHLRPDGSCSWYEFAQYFIEQARQFETLTVKKIDKVSSSEFPTVAKRPSWSVLDNEKLKRFYNLQFESWQSYADACLREKYADC